MMKRVISFVILAMVVGLAVGSADAEMCRHIPNVISLSVAKEDLVVTFGFDILVKDDGILQVMDVLDSNGFIRDIDHAEVQYLQYGETLRWGDGDHVSHSMEVLSIDGALAKIKFLSEHRPPWGEIEILDDFIVNIEGKCDVQRLTSN